MHYEEAGGSVRTPGDDSESLPQKRKCISRIKVGGYIQMVTVMGADGTELGPTRVSCVDAPQGETLEGVDPDDFPNPAKLKGSQQSFCLTKECKHDEVGYEEYQPVRPPDMDDDDYGGGLQPLHDLRIGIERRGGFYYRPPSHVPVTYRYSYMWISYGYVKIMPCCDCEYEENCKGEKKEFEWDIDFELIAEGKEVLQKLEDMIEKDLKHKPCPPAGSDGTTTQAMESGDNALNPEHLVGRSARKNVEVLNHRRVGRPNNNRGI